MKKLKFNTASFLATLLVFYAALVFLIWRQASLHLQEDRRQTLTDAVRHHNNLVFTLEQTAVHTIREGDGVLRLVKHEIEQSGAGLSLDRLVNGGLGNLPVFDGLAVFDAAGDFVNAYPAALRFQNVNLSGRQHFSVHKTAADTLFISEPLLSSSLHQPVIVISRRLNDRRGNFAGTVALQMRPSEFMEFYKAAGLNKHDILSLISTSGVTLSRRTGNVESSGENIKQSPLFREVQRSAVGAYFAPDAIRGIPTYFSYRRLKDYPLIATVGRSEADILAQFYARQKREQAFAVILSLLLLVFCSYVFLNFLQRRNAVRLLISNEARYRSIFNSSQDAILLLRPGGKIVAMNPSAHTLFRTGHTGEETYFHQLTPTVLPLVLLEEGQETEKEFEIERRDGSAFTGEIVSSGFRDAHRQQHVLLLVRDVSARKRMENRLADQRKRHQLELAKNMISAQEAEREAIGRELHDNVNQVLTTVKLYLETALGNPPNKDALIHRSVHYLVQSIREIRNLSHSLAVPATDAQSLVESMMALADNIQACSSMRIDIRSHAFDRPLLKEQNLALYRIVQEQLSNIVKHAGATEVSITLQQNGEKTALRIADNGKGYAPGEDRRGIGIWNMESRAKALGGEFRISSSPGEGCAVEVTLPFVAGWQAQESRAQ